MSMSKFGRMNGPIPGTRVYARMLPGFDLQKMTAHAIIVIDDRVGFYTTANVYGLPGVENGSKVDGHVGGKFDPAECTYALGETRRDRAKQADRWLKKGYLPVPVDEFDMVDPAGEVSESLVTVEAE